MASRASSPLSHDKNECSTTHFNGPIVKYSESEAVSTSTGLVASVTWPDLRYPCSLAGKNSSAMVAQHLDGNRLRATLAPNVGLDVLSERTRFCEDRLPNAGLEVLSIPSSFPENRPANVELEDLSMSCSFPDCRSNMGHLGLSAPASFSEQRLDARHEVLSRQINSANDRFPSERLEGQPRRTSFSEYRFPSDGLESQSARNSFPQNRPNIALECQLIQTSLPETRYRTVRLQNPAVEVDRRPTAKLVSWSLTSLFSTNMAISETNGHSL